jgi:hypothetical protein
MEGQQEVDKEQLHISAEQIVCGDEGADGENRECQERYGDGAIRHAQEGVVPPVVDQITYSSSC